MSKEQKEKVVETNTTDSTKKKDNSTSFLGRFKNQVKTLILKIINLLLLLIIKITLMNQL